MIDYTSAKDALNRTIGELRRAIDAIEREEAAQAAQSALDAGAPMRTAEELPPGTASAEVKNITAPNTAGTAVSLESPAMAPARAAGATSAPNTAPSDTSADDSDADASKKRK